MLCCAPVFASVVSTPATSSSGGTPFAQIVVPDHKELDRGTLRAILRQSDVTIERFIALLR
jgi:hypothetical protein